MSDESGGSSLRDVVITILIIAVIVGIGTVLNALPQ